MNTQMLPVCPDAEIGVTPAALRQRRYRQGAAYQERLAKAREWRKRRRAEWQAERRRGCHLTFDGRAGGPINTNLPRLGDYWIGKDGRKLNQ